jgi:hypothetical protein
MAEYWGGYGRRLLLGLMALAAVDAMILLIPSVSFSWQDFAFINLVLFVPIALILLIPKKKTSGELNPRNQFIVGFLWLILGAVHGVILLGSEITALRILLAATNLCAGCLFLIQGWKRRVLLG